MRRRYAEAPRWVRALLAVVLLAALVGVGVFGVRAYRSYTLLRSAHELGAGDLGSIRPWMTVRYIARRYHVPEPALLAQLGLPPATAPDTTLRALAQQQGRPTLDYVKDVQRAVDTVRRAAAPPAPPRSPDAPAPPAPPDGGHEARP